MEYGATLNLPQTDFPMRGNLPQREPEFLESLAGNEYLQNSSRKKPG